MYPYYNKIMKELELRIHGYYNNLNKGFLLSAYQYIDLDVTDANKVESDQYINIMRLKQHLFDIGLSSVIIMEVHLDELNPRYKNRDFAIGTIRSRRYTLKEEWVRDDKGLWYNRNITPCLWQQLWKI